MNAVKEHITLDASKQGSQVTLTAKRGDTQSRALSVNLTSGGMAYEIAAGSSCYLYCITAGSNTVITSECTISGNYITITVPSSVFATAGITKCEITLFDGANNQLTSPRFEYNVEDALYDENAVTATDDYSALTAALATANKFGSVSAAAQTLAAGSAATAAAEIGNSGVSFNFGIPQGVQGIQGLMGNGIVSIIRTSGTGAAGTTDTYTVAYSDGTTSTFNVYNGADGQGSGDMLKSIYDSGNKNQDVFAYADQAKADAKAASRPVSWLPAAEEIGAAAASHTHTPQEAGAAPAAHAAATNNPHGVTAAQVGAMSGSTVVLWSGSQSSSATLTLSEEYTQFAFLQMNFTVHDKNQLAMFTVGAIDQNTQYAIFPGQTDSVNFTGNTTVLFTKNQYSVLKKITGVE